eukprot:g5890.t1
MADHGGAGSASGHAGAGGGDSDGSDGGAGGAGGGPSKKPKGEGDGGAEETKTADQLAALTLAAPDPYGNVTVFWETGEGVMQVVLAGLRVEKTWTLRQLTDKIRRRIRLRDEQDFGFRSKHAAMGMLLPADLRPEDGTARADDVLLDDDVYLRVDEEGEIEELVRGFAVNICPIRYCESQGGLPAAVYADGPSIKDHLGVAGQEEQIKNIFNHVQARIFADVRASLRSDPTIKRIFLTRQALVEHKGDVIAWKAVVETTQTLINPYYRVYSKPEQGANGSEGCFLSMHGSGQWRTVKVTANAEEVKAARKEKFNREIKGATVQFTFKQGGAPGGVQHQVMGKPYTLIPDQLLVTSIAVMDQVFSPLYVANAMARELVESGKDDISSETRRKLEAQIEDECSADPEQRLKDCRFLLEDFQRFPQNLKADGAKMPLADFMEPIRKYFDPKDPKAKSHEIQRKTGKPESFTRTMQLVPSLTIVFALSLGNKPCRPTQPSPF